MQQNMDPREAQSYSTDSKYNTYGQGLPPQDATPTLSSTYNPVVGGSQSPFFGTGSGHLSKASAGMRLALAIVSLGVLIPLVAIVGSNFFALVLMCAVVVIINAVFNVFA